jgi:hypothetical protein
MTWSTNGFERRAPGGTPKTWMNCSFSSCRCASVSKAPSKLRTGREPLRQLPVNWSSSLHIGQKWGSIAGLREGTAHSMEVFDMELLCRAIRYS